MVKYFVWWEIIRRESKYNFTTSFPQSGTFISLSQSTCQTRKCIKLAAILIIKEKSAWVSDYCDGQRSSVCKLWTLNSHLSGIVFGFWCPWQDLGCRVWVLAHRAESDGRAGSGERRALTVNTSPGSHCSLLRPARSPELSEGREGVIQLVTRQTHHSV